MSGQPHVLQVTESRSIPDRCVPVGDVNVADNGGSYGCGEERVKRHVESELCRLDGDYS